MYYVRLNGAALYARNVTWGLTTPLPKENFWSQWGRALCAECDGEPFPFGFPFQTDVSMGPRFMRGM